jgi:hypothetical protein
LRYTFHSIKQFYFQYKSTKISTRSDKKNKILSVQMLTIQYTNKQYGGSVKCHLHLQNNEQQITDSDLPKQTAQIFFFIGTSYKWGHIYSSISTHNGLCYCHLVVLTNVCFRHTFLISLPYSFTKHYVSLHTRFTPYERQYDAYDSSHA